jgi:hypothetical protein
MVGVRSKGLTTGVPWIVHRFVVEVEGLSPVRSVPPTESPNNRCAASWEVFDVRPLSDLLLLTKRIGRSLSFYGWTDRRFDATTRVPVAGLGAPVSTRRTRGGLAIAVGIAMSLAACTSGASAPTTTSGSPSTVATTTATSSSSPTTAQPSSTTVSSTTSVSATSIAPTAKVEADVRAAVTNAASGFSACLIALPKCDVATLAATRAGDTLAINTKRINEWNAAGYVVRERDKFRIVIESVELAPDLKRATAMVCYADGSKLISPGTGPDGADVVIDDTYGSGREAWDMRLDADGVWRLYWGPLVGAKESRDICPAA